MRLSLKRAFIHCLNRHRIPSAKIMECARVTISIFPDDIYFWGLIFLCLNASYRVFDRWLLFLNQTLSFIFSLFYFFNSCPQIWKSRLFHRLIHVIFKFEFQTLYFWRQTRSLAKFMSLKCFCGVVF